MKETSVSVVFPMFDTVTRLRGDRPDIWKTATTVNAATYYMHITCSGAIVCYLVPSEEQYMARYVAETAKYSARFQTPQTSRVIDTSIHDPTSDPEENLDVSRTNLTPSSWSEGKMG